VQPKLAAPEIAIPLPEAPTTIANRPQPQDLQIKESIQAKPVSPQEDLGSLSPTSDVSIPIALPPKANPAPSRRGWVWMGVGAIVLLGAIALIVWGIGKSNSNPAPTQTVAVQAALPSPTPTPKAQTTPTLGVGLIQVSSKDGMMQMYVPAGDFLMGSDKAKDLQAYANEMPQHTVYLDAYWIDRTEVNNGQYRRCVTLGACGAPGNMGSTIRSSYFLDTRFAYYPVIYVNWTQAKAYCTWAGRRLPSEAEWEKAARGTDGLTYPWGNETPNQNLLNFNQNLSDTTKVGNYPSGASPYGALDMAGNVWEWVNDWYADNFYQESPAHNPTGPGPKYLHVTRGGSWYYSNSLARSAYRNGIAPNTSNGDTGFRCAASITP
jgi:formylglycine-generating enzyme required for sulfatase activity